MIDIKLDTSGFDKLRADFPKRHAAALTSALRSESYRLNQKIRDYARSQGEGQWKYAPITKYLRKGRGYGAWLARFARYYVDDKASGGPRAYAGLIDKRSLGSGAARFKPISSSFATAARRQASGFSLYISGRGQRRMASRLLNPNAGHFTKMKTAKGAQRKWDAIHAAIPRVGWRMVKARPFIEPVLQAEQDHIGRNINALYAAKFNGNGFSRDWAAEWGNE